jgi:XTP/dITP diphosphohydrolase
LLNELRGIAEERRTARFVCVLALLRHPADPTPLICQGIWEGLILAAPRGVGGFGYDPVFLVPGENRAAAELDLTVKNRLSHRGQALAQLRRALALDPVPPAVG